MNYTRTFLLVLILTCPGAIRSAEDAAVLNSRLIMLCQRPDTTQDEIIEQIEAGADPNVRDEHNLTPLYYAIDAANIEACQALLEHGAAINARLAYLTKALRSDPTCQIYKLLLVKGRKNGKFHLLRLILRGRCFSSEEHFNLALSICLEYGITLPPRTLGAQESSEFLTTSHMCMRRVGLPYELIRGVFDWLNKPELLYNIFYDALAYGRVVPRRHRSELIGFLYQQQVRSILQGFAPLCSFHDQLQCLGAGIRHLNFDIVNVLRDPVRLEREFGERMVAAIQERLERPPAIYEDPYHLPERVPAEMTYGQKAGVILATTVCAFIIYAYYRHMSEEKMENGMFFWETLADELSNRLPEILDKCLNTA